ncbi:MAG TPA: RNA polymerase sigma factor [bacterium]|nr:RNA polymerase sigma factor [bacterium]
MTINHQQDDSINFQKIYHQYRELVFNVCYRMTGNREDADDAAQDVFLKIHHSISRFKGDAKLSSWIFRIAVNTCLNRERRKKLVSWVSLDFLFQEESKDQPLSDDRPDWQVETQETERIVQQAIQKLPARQKSALVLHRYENLSYDEIAKVMKVSLSAVESLLHRAKENLAAKLIPLLKK